jgi:hypothetical protein
MRNRLFTAFIINILIILMGVVIILRAMEDREGPEIIFEDVDIIYKKGEAVDKLYVGVKAYDQLDGDVTSSLMIEGIHVLEAGDKASIIYVAKDYSNNVTKVSRIVDYVSQDVSVKEPVEEDENLPLTEEAQETSTDVGNLVDGSQDATNGASDETGDETAEEVDEGPLVSTGAPIIRLNTHKVTISRGTRFNPMKYVAEAVDDKDDAWRRVYVDGNYSVNRPGEYVLKYSIRDSDGNMSNVEELVLVVE